MKKKALVVSILFGIFLISIVSAGLIDYFGKITGSVEVSGPVFYLDGIHEDGGVYHQIYVNVIPPEEEIYFWDGHRLVFKTEDLGVDEFYQIKLKGTIWMKTNNSGNTIQARFIKLNELNYEKTICEVSEIIVIGATDNFWKYEFECSSEGEIDLSDYERIGLELRGNGDENQEYWVSTGKKYSDGYSRIEVSAI